MEHHADFAVPITHRLWIETTLPRTTGHGTIQGQAIALGWWVGPNINADGTPGEAVGTLYLVVDPEQPGPPWWVRQAHVARARVT